MKNKLNKGSINGSMINTDLAKTIFYGVNLTAEFIEVKNIDETAKEIKKQILQGHIGDVKKIVLNISVSFDFNYSDKEWFLSVATHEIYFLNQLFDTFNMYHFNSQKDFK